MTLIDTLKEALLTARRGGEAAAAEADALRFLVGETDRYAKSDRRAAGRAGQPLDDAETVKVIQGVVASVDASLEQAGRLGRDLSELTMQRALFGRYLPAMLTSTELDQAILEIIAAHPQARLGDVMRGLQERYPRRYDGQDARVRIQQRLAG